jgi:hypothetical protein
VSDTGRTVAAISGIPPIDAAVAAFRRELREAGFALTHVPGGTEACKCDPVDRVVYIGSDIKSEKAQAIIGLHELGHAFADVGRFACEGTMMLLRGSDEYVRYAVELAAWEWAERALAGADLDTLAELDSWRAYGLNSYRREEQL